MSTIALCMIVRDPKEGLRNCLASVRPIIHQLRIVCTHKHFLDDIVKDVYATFGESPNHKVVFCEQACEGCNMEDDEPCFNLAAARNYSFQDVNTDWILWLDADDIVSEESCRRIKELAEEKRGKVDTLTFTYDYSSSVSHLRERLIANKFVDPWNMPIHECIGYMSIGTWEDHPEVHITHCRQHQTSERNLKIFQRVIENDDECVNDPRFRFYHAESLSIAGKYPEALAAYNSAISLGLCSEDKFRTLLGKARCYKELDEQEVAAEMLSYAAAQFPEFPDAFFMLGQLYSDMERYDKSLACYKIVANMDMPEVTGFIYDKSMKYFSMEKIYRIYLDKIPDLKQAWYWAKRCSEALPEGLNIDGDLELIRSELMKQDLDVGRDVRCIDDIQLDEVSLIRDEDGLPNGYGIGGKILKFHTERVINIAFVHRGPDENPAIRMRIGAVFERLGDFHPSMHCYDWHQDGKKPDVLVMGLPYDWKILEQYDGPVIIDYPEDLLGEGTYLNTLEQEALKMSLEKEQVKAVVVSSEALKQQIGVKAVYISEMACDRD